MNSMYRGYSMRAGRVALAGVLGAGLLLSAVAPVAEASSLSSAQIASITSLLATFNVASSTIAQVQAVLSGQSASSTSAVDASTIGFLRRGDHGKGVCVLHAILAADPAISVNITAGDAGGDCPFGPVTENALKAFQQEHGIEALGIVGPKTLAALRAHLEDNPLAVEDSNEASSTGSGIGLGRGHLCAIVPPGHLIAPGWLRHHDNERPDVPVCQQLPPGIDGQPGGEDSHGTTTPDTVAPIISAISASSVASTTATISWTTNETANGTVYYSTVTPIDLSSAPALSAGAFTTSHSFSLTGLTATTTYTYVVQSADAANNVATSSPQTFTTGS